MVTSRRHSNHDQDRRRGAEREGGVLTAGDSATRRLGDSAVHAESPNAESPAIAITTDWLTSFGGAERVLQHLHALYPQAPIYTSVFDPRRLPSEFATWDVRPTILQRFPGVRRYSRALLPLMPWAFDRLDLSEYDVVITTSTAFSKNVTVRAGATHICYCLTPPRYLWDLADEYMARVPGGRLLSPVIRHLRQRDREAAQRADVFLADSGFVAERIRRVYDRDAAVLYAPVDTHRIKPNGREPEDFYLVVSRLVPYKRVDLAIEACNRLGRRLVVVGTGPAEARLRKLAGPTIEFTGPLKDPAVVDLYARCRAFLFPGLEDFGITPVEAQAAGRPVVAFNEGGARETVVQGKTGVLFDEQTVESLVAAIEQLERAYIDPAACRHNAERFDGSVFREQMAGIVMGATRRLGDSATRQFSGI